MESNRILVTGGAGFIGINLVNELKCRGHSVTGLDLYNTDRYNYLRADVRNYRQLERVTVYNAFDYVYHLPVNTAVGMGEDYYETSGNKCRRHIAHDSPAREAEVQNDLLLQCRGLRDYEGVMTGDVMVTTLSRSLAR